MNIYKGKVSKALKVLLYGPEGVGKSTFASQFPEPLFIDTEGSTDHMDVMRTDKPTSWAMLCSLVDEVIADPFICRTLVIDTADWAERLCMENIMSVNKVSSIESLGYGKGYVMLMEQFGKLLDKLSLLVDKGINVVLTAHAQMRNVSLPDEMGNYDRWELKMQKKTCPMIKEWADMVLFVNYKTRIVKDENGKGKGTGGKRVMYTTHHTTYDAKNRFGLKEELPFDYGEIAYLFAPVRPVKPKPVPVADKPTPPPEEIVLSVPVDSKPVESKPAESKPEEDDSWSKDPKKMEALSKLLDLMKQDGITNQQIEKAVSANFEMYPKGTPIRNYDTDFINGMLIGEWKTVKEIIAEMEDVPF